MAHNGYIQLLGKTSLAASVTANGFAALRQGTEFSREVSFVNTAAPHLESLLTSDGSIFTTTEAFIPLATTSPSYDNDGNLTADGQFLYTWDALNRLILVRRSPAALTAGAPFAKVSYQYDAAGRMFLRQVFANETAATPSRSTYYLYHGWNCYAECESLSATPTLASAALARSHVWGLDLSSTMEGAGGVGGLVWTKNQGTGANHLVCQDGNGNVRKLINSSTFAISASYDYGPFGELLRASGPEAKANRYRFSTKPQDPVTGLLYYINRWYDSTNGRWPSRDPIEEKGGMNLYGFVGNDGVNRWDRLGMVGSITIPDSSQNWGANRSRPSTNPDRAEIESANAEFDRMVDHMFYPISSNLSRTYDNDHAWTMQMKKKPVYDRMRIVIKKELRTRCKDGPEGVIVFSGKWDDSSDDLPVWQFAADLLVYANGASLKSTGSVIGRFSAVAECNKCEGDVFVTLTDTLRAGSMSRIPGKIPIIGDIEILDDKVLNRVNLTWMWNEKIDF